jgi:hypothetical protein
MKHIIICTVLLFIGEAIQAQSKLIDSTYWIEYSIDSRDQSIKFKNHLFIQGDTLLNTLTYKKLFSDNDFYAGCVRESSNKYYAVLTYYKPHGEVLIYDFSGSIGDTIKSNAPEGLLSRSPVITEIDTIELENNEKRKLFYLNKGEDIWIDGIGSIFGFLFPTYDHITNYITPHLVCFKQKEAVYYRNDTLNECCSIPTNVQLKQNGKINVGCYPNPTLGKVKITLPTSNENKELIIKDITGKEKWKKTHFSDNSYELDLSYFNNGIYILTIKGKNFVTSKKIIKY